MYRRYVIIGLVFFLLIGAYFVFFDNKKSDREYNKYYSKLVDRDTYNDVLDDVTLSIDEIEEDNKYSYIITFDNVSERKDNVKILIAKENVSDNEEYFPSFGIISNKGYSIVMNNSVVGENEVKGVNLTILNSDKIESMLIYFFSDDGEQFVKINVVNYLQ